MKDNPIDPDSPIWEAKDFERARPVEDVLPSHLARLLTQQPAAGLKSQLAQQPPLARGFGIAA